MKSLGLVFSYLAGTSRQRNLRLVLYLVGVFVALVTIFSVLFHVLMAHEGRNFSWMTGVYWTLTVMSTLGFGDITFESDAGRLFTVVVLVSGALFILVLLPFVFIQFVFMPFVAWRDANRAPRKLGDRYHGHLLLIGLSAVTDGVIRRARDADMEYVLIEPDHDHALKLHDQGYNVMIGDIDHPDTYRAARVDHAALVAVTVTDTTNTNVTFTVREISANVPIVATASAPETVDILELAGANQVLQLGEILGQAIARRVLGGDGRSHVIGEFGGLKIAEASALHPDLVGRTLQDAGVRQRCGVHVVGTWDRGKYHAWAPATIIEPNTVLILAGSAEQLVAYDDLYGVPVAAARSVVIIGAGRVGRAAGQLLARADVPHRIIEKRGERVRDDRYVHGDAADINVLNEAGLEAATAVLITTHDDDVNVYLTIYCRRLRPDVQIISRANLDRNVATLHRAGADAVLSYATLGASSIWNNIGENDTLILADGLEVFRVDVPKALRGKTLADSGIRESTGCTVVATAIGDEIRTDTDPQLVLQDGVDLILIADLESQQRFANRFHVG